MVAGADNIGQAVGMAQIAPGLLHIAFGDQLADISGADHPAVQHYGLDDITAYALRLTIFLQTLGCTLALVAKAEIMAHHDPSDVQLLDNVIGKVLPGHAHQALVEVQKNHIVNTVDPADNVLPADGAVDQRRLPAENQIVRVHIEAEHRGHGLDLGRPLLGPLQQRPMADVYAVKKTQRNGSLYL